MAMDRYIIVVLMSMSEMVSICNDGEIVIFLLSLRSAVSGTAASGSPLYCFESLAINSLTNRKISP